MSAKAKTTGKRNRQSTGRRVRAASTATPWKNYAAGSEIDHFAKFCRDYLRLSTDRWAGQPLKLEPFQRKIMGEALAFDDGGNPYWTSVVIVLPRKNGKTNLLAAYAVYRLIIQHDSPEILLAAASDRNAGRLFKAAANFIRLSPELSQLARVRDYAGEIVREDGLGVIYRVASDPNRLHGYDPSLVICDELGQWTKPSLEDAFAALTTGGGARGAPQTFTITTAGEASTRHASILGRLLDAGEKAADRTDKPGLMLSRIPESKMIVFNHEAPTTDPHDVKKMKLANPAPWITTEYLLKQANNDELTDAQVLQLHGCVWAAAQTTFIEPAALQKALYAGAKRELADGEEIVLGFDGSESRDETWLVACTIDGLVWPLQRWARPMRAEESWRIPRREIHDAIEAAFKRYEVRELAADPPGWYSELDDWVDRYGEERVLAFETRQPSRMAPACERMRTGVRNGSVVFGGPLAGELLGHFGNCVTRLTPYGDVVNKDHPDSPRKIDGAIASCIAFDRMVALEEEDEDFVFFVDPKPEEVKT